MPQPLAADCLLGKALGSLGCLNTSKACCRQRVYRQGGVLMPQPQAADCLSGRALGSLGWRNCLDHQQQRALLTLAILLDFCCCCCRLVVCLRQEYSSDPELLGLTFEARRSASAHDRCAHNQEKRSGLGLRVAVVFS